MCISNEVGNSTSRENEMKFDLSRSNEWTNECMNGNVKEEGIYGSWDSHRLIYNEAYIFIDFERWRLEVEFILIKK